MAMYHNDDIPCQLSILLSKLNSNKFHYPDLTQFNPAKTSNISPNTYLNKYFNKYPKPIASPRIQISLNQMSLFIL